MTLSSITAGLDGPSDLTLIDITREGVPASILEELSEALSMDRESLAKVLHISEQTLSSSVQQNASLTADESDRAIRLTRILSFAREMIGNPAKAAHWLQTPNRALNANRPIDILDTDTGVEAVRNVLGRIAYGIYS